MTALRALDGSAQYFLKDAVAAVASNIATLNNDERERVLLAVAVLYGIVRARRKPHATTPKGE